VVDASKYTSKKGVVCTCPPHTLQIFFEWFMTMEFVEIEKRLNLS
jgi:hypothetical protein